MSQQPQAAKTISRWYETRVLVTLLCILVSLAATATVGRLTATKAQQANRTATNGWQRYQDSRSRYRIAELARDLSLTNGFSDNAERYARKEAKEQRMSEDWQKTSRAAEETASMAFGQGRRLRFGEMLLEVALGLASFAIFKKSEMVWIAAVCSTVLGLVTAGAGALLQL